MSMEENDAATVLSQMSQLGCPPFDISSSSVVENDAMLDADAIGATCTLQPSSLSKLNSTHLFPMYPSSAP